MRILSVVGARPQFVKACVVSRALSRRPHITEMLVHTGQHYDANMSAIFFEELGLPEPAYHLGVGSAPHGVQTARMLERIEQLIIAERADWVLVYGDTNSTLAGALAAAKLHVPVAHVEAGLRSFNRRMPEEINRVLTDQMSELLLAPTEVAVTHLEREGLPARRIRLVGDVMYDAALLAGAAAEARRPLLAREGVEKGRYVLATIHRAENTDDPDRLRAIVDGLVLTARTIPVLLPLHPRTRAAVRGLGIGIDELAGVRTLPPLGYLDMAALERFAAVIATDSGGVQKEAFFYGVPAVTLREETEWVELVELGWNRLCPPFDARCVADTILESVGTTGRAAQPYGEGAAAEKVADALIDAVETREAHPLPEPAAFHSAHRVAAVPQPAARG